jgi:aminocarboxymuconate-semialdehyde decarboxylase
MPASLSALLKIDLHTHILPERWPDLEQRYGYGGFVRLERTAPTRGRLLCNGRCFREVDENCWSAPRRIEECDRAGIDVQVLSTVPVMFSYWAKAADAHDLARLLNDHIAGVVHDHPRRFVGLGTLPLQETALALSELERCRLELGLAGVQIGTHVNGRNLDDAELFPVLELAESLGAAVFVHPWEMLAPERMSRHWLQWLVGMPTETALAISSLILGGVLERLPRLRVGFAHGGGSFVGTLGRIQRGFEVRPDLCATATRLPPVAQLESLYFDTLVHDTDVLRHLLRRFGARRLALGTDYPFPLGEERAGALVDSLEELDAAERERIFGGTALEFLALPPARFAA